MNAPEKSYNASMILLGLGVGLFLVYCIKNLYPKMGWFILIPILAVGRAYFYVNDIIYKRKSNLEKIEKICGAKDVIRR